MIKKTTFSKPSILQYAGFVKALLVAVILTFTSFSARSAELTTFSLTSSSTIAGDTTMMTFTYQIVTAAPNMILYAYLPLGSTTKWLTLDSVDVTIGGTPVAINAGLSEASNKSLKITLSNPALATAGSTVIVTAYAVNSASFGNYNWDFIRTANSGGSPVDEVYDLPKFKIDPPVPDNLPPNEATFITDTSFLITWNPIDYAFGYVLEVSRNEFFNQYVPGYNNIDVSGFSQQVYGLSPNTIYYFRIRAFNTTGMSDYSPYKTCTTIKEHQTITFNNLPSKEYGAADFNLSATATSGLTVSFSSSDANVATVTGTLVQIVGVGTTTITASQAGNASFQPAPNVLKDLVITPMNLLVTGLAANDKVYDALDTATISSFGSLAGVINADVVSIDGSSATAKFANKNVGNNKTVTVTGLLLAGADSANYSIGNPTTTADITIRSLSLQRVDVVDKVYDGNTDATISNPGVLINIASGDVVDAVITEAEATFANKNAGDSIAVTITDVTLAGADSDNYVLDSIYLAYGNISKATITITANNDSKVADGVPYSGGNGMFYQGFITGEYLNVLIGIESYGGTSQGATAAGTYTIIPQGLTAANYEIVYVNGTLTISTVGIDDDVRIAPETYPNPFSNILNINNAEMVSQISISNLVGQEVVNYTNNGSSEISIPVDYLKQGIYIMVVKTVNGKNITQKIIKK